MTARRPPPERGARGLVLRPAAMVSDHDTDELSGSSRESTDPGFPGPGSNERQMAARPAARAAHEARISDTLPAAPKAEAKAATPAAPSRATRPSSNPPPSKPARSESIDELLDGLAGEGQLPRKSQPGERKRPPAPPVPSPRAPKVMPKSESVIVAAPRAPAPPTATPDELPSVLVREEKAPASRRQVPIGDDDDELDGDRRSDATVLTPTSMARRLRVGSVIAGVLGITVAVGVLAFVRQMTRGDAEAVAPVTAAAPGSVQPIAPAATAGKPSGQAPTAKALAPTAPTDSSKAGAPPAKTVAAHPGAPVVAPAPAKDPAARSGAVPAASTNLDEFRKTIRQ